MSAPSKAGACAIPPRAGECRDSSWLLPLLFLALAALGSTVLFFFDPAQHGFYPFCLFYRTTGLQCPACGSLRALHHLLHGELLQALQFNALLVLSLPYLAFLVLRAAARWFNPELRYEPVRRGLFWAAVVLVTIFGIVRNLHPLGAWLGFAL